MIDFRDLFLKQKVARMNILEKFCLDLKYVLFPKGSNSRPSIQKETNVTLSKRQKPPKYFLWQH